ncbi:hypothetical protein WJX77_003821 [Trebouxia sp. C0004]
MGSLTEAAADRLSYTEKMCKYDGRTPASIVINRKKGLVDAQTSKTKRSFADIQQNVLHDFVAGSKAHPLQITGTPLALRQEQHRQQQTFDADAEFFKMLEQTGWLPSASGVVHAPKLFARLRDHANILNHRPINNHGVPLPLMQEAFGEFVDIFNTGIPTHSDCNFAVDLCKVASEVWESETKQLQPRLHALFVKYFEGFEVRSATDFEAEPDKRMIYKSMDIGAWELKIDTNGNTYGQIQRCQVCKRNSAYASKLATFHQQLAAQASPTPFQQSPSARLPYYFATAYPEASVQQLLSQTRLIFLVTTTNGQQRLVKFVPCCQNRSQGGTQAHRAWADAQCAPDLLHVKSLCGQWYAVEMEYLAPRDGWFPLCILAPGE